MFLRFIICLTLSFSLEITGKVLDIDSKEPVIGANIEIGEQGTATDKMGVFFIELNSDQINKLKISHISYVDLEYSFSSNKNILIYLEPSVINVGELVVTGTRTQKTFKDSPILTRIINHQEIKQSQSKNLYDIMNEIFPGYQRLKGEHSMSNEVRFNGLGTKSMLFMVDGQKVNAEFAGNMDLSVIDINNIEKIEYVDGAISTLYGSGAMGGAINVITKDSDQFDFNVNLFSNDPILNSISASSSYKLGVFNLFSSFNKKQSKGFDLKEIEYSNPTDIQKHQEEFDDILFNHKIEYQSNLTDYIFNYRFYKSEINTYRIEGDPFSGFSETPSFERPTNYNSAVSFKIKSIINDGAFFDLSFGLEDYEKHYRYAGFNEVFWSGSYNKDLSFTFSKNFNKGSHLFGLNMINDEYVSVDIDPDGDGDFDQESIFESGDSEQVDEYSIFYNNEFIVNDLNITSGIRLQYHESYDNHFIPMLSVCKKFEKYNLRSMWSKGYRTPNLKELYYQWEHPGGTVLGDPNLKPEESEYFSFSLESLKDFYYSINIYQNSLKNMISYITDETTHTYTNFEQVTLNGVNLFYKRKLAGRGELAFSYNYLDAYNEILKKRLDGSNYHNLNIKLAYFILDNMKARLSYKYSSPKKYSTCVQNCSGDEENNIYKLSEFTLIDVSLRYDISKSITATVGIDNIFDFRDKKSTSEQFLTVVNPGRNFFISFDYNINKLHEE